MWGRRGECGIYKLPLLRFKTIIKMSYIGLYRVSQKRAIVIRAPFLKDLELFLKTNKLI